jgi:outer membrane protein assembly factor BamB
MRASTTKLSINRTCLGIACATGLLGACATEPVVEPTPLASITAETSIDRSWRKSIGNVSRGRFSPYVDSGFVYVADSGGSVYSFDQSSGKVLWKQSLDVGLGSGVSGSGKQVYVSSDDGEIYALQASTGDVVWTRTASSEVLVPVSAGFDSVVVRSADGRVVSLDPATGEERWSMIETPPALTINGYSQPYLLDGGVLVGLDDGRLIALNLATGKPIWETIVSLPSGRSEVERLVDIDANILTDDEAIYVVNYRGKLARIEPVKGQIQWTVPMSSTAGIAQSDSLLVVVDEFDVVHGVEKATGLVAWTQEATKGRRLGQPVINNGAVLVGDSEGVLHGLALDDGRLIARNTQFDAAVGNPVIADDVVFVQFTDGSVSALSLNR